MEQIYTYMEQIYTYREKDYFIWFKNLSQLPGNKFVFGSPWLYNCQVQLQKLFKSRSEAAHSETTSSNVTKFSLSTNLVSKHFYEHPGPYFWTRLCTGTTTVTDSINKIENNSI